MLFNTTEYQFIQAALESDTIPHLGVDDTQDNRWLLTPCHHGRTGKRYKVPYVTLSRGNFHITITKGNIEQLREVA